MADVIDRRRRDLVKPHDRKVHALEVRDVAERVNAKALQPPVAGKLDHPPPVRDHEIGPNRRAEGSRGRFQEIRQGGAPEIFPGIPDDNRGNRPEMGRLLEGVMGQREQRPITLAFSSWSQHRGLLRLALDKGPLSGVGMNLDCRPLGGRRHGSSTATGATATSTVLPPPMTI